MADDEKKSRTGQSLEDFERGLYKIFALARKQSGSEDDGHARVKKARKAPEGGPVQRTYGKWKTSKFFVDYIKPGPQRSPQEELKFQKLFGRRFRFTKNGFERVMQLAYEAMPELRASTDHAQRVDGRLLVLSCLRLLARDCFFDDLAEVTNVSASKLCKFFEKFVISFSEKHYDTYVASLTSTEEKVREVVLGFEQLMLPGCIGCIDCTHVAWDCVPAMRFNDAKGAKGYASVVCEMVCDSRRRILHVSSAQAGALNDMQISFRSEFVRRLDEGGHDILVEYEFTLVGSNGERITRKGVWILSDGGYVQGGKFVMPLKPCPFTSPKEAAFSKYLESVRKHIECVFGALKKRFYVLKGPLRFHDAAVITAVFRTCAILHNLLIQIKEESDAAADADAADADAADVDSEDSDEETDADMPRFREKKTERGSAAAKMREAADEKHRADVPVVDHAVSSVATVTAAQMEEQGPRHSSTNLRDQLRHHYEVESQKREQAKMPFKGFITKPPKR